MGVVTAVKELRSMSRSKERDAAVVRAVGTQEGETNSRREGLAALESRMAHWLRLGTIDYTPSETDQNEGATRPRPSCSLIHCSIHILSNRDQTILSPWKPSSVFTLTKMSVVALSIIIAGTPAVYTFCSPKCHDVACGSVKFITQIVKNSFPSQQAY